jgi:hypothetical protein
MAAAEALLSKSATYAEAKQILEAARAVVNATRRAA